MEKIWVKKMFEMFLKCLKCSQFEPETNFSHSLTFQKKTRRIFITLLTQCIPLGVIKKTWHTSQAAELEVTWRWWSSSTASDDDYCGLSASHNRPEKLNDWLIECVLKCSVAQKNPHWVAMRTFLQHYFFT